MYKKTRRTKTRTTKTRKTKTRRTKTRRTKTRRTKRLRRRSGGVGPICASHAENNDCTRYSNNCNKYAYSGKDGQLYTCRHPVNKSKSCQPVSAVLKSKKLCPVQQLNSSPRPISPRPISPRPISPRPQELPVRTSRLTLPRQSTPRPSIQRQSTPIPSRDSREEYTLNKAATSIRQKNLRSTRKKKNLDLYNDAERVRHRSPQGRSPKQQTKKNISPKRRTPSPPRQQLVPFIPYDQRPFDFDAY